MITASKDGYRQKKMQLNIKVENVKIAPLHIQKNLMLSLTFIILIQKKKMFLGINLD